MTDLVQLATGILLQIVFCAFLADSANIMAKRFLPASSVIERTCSAGIIAFWLGSAMFNILINLKMFFPLPALLMAAAIFAAVRFGSEKTTTNSLLIPATRLCQRLFKRFNKSLTGKVAALSFLALFSLLLSRSLLLPMVGWDSLVYHTLKAGLWIQTGQHYNLDSPGLWQSYKTFFGGGEAFTALAMIFTSSDISGSMPDLILWGLLGLSSLALQRELQIKGTARYLITVAFLCCPIIAGAVGSGYVDNGLAGFLMAGTLFFIKFFRNGKNEHFMLAATAYGLAGAMKATGLATGLIMLALLLIYAKVKKLTSLSQISLAALLFASSTGPWLLFNHQISGYILGSIPAAIGPLVLGVMPLPFAYLCNSSDVQAYSLTHELYALWQSLSGFGLFAALLFLVPCGIAAQIKKSNQSHWVSLTPALIISALYFSPSFSAIRLLWAGSNGRFISAAIILFAVFFPCMGSGKTARLARFICCLAIPLGLTDYLIRYFFSNFSQVEISILLVGACITGLSYAALNKTWTTLLLHQKAVLLITTTLLLVMAANVKDFLRDESYKSAFFLHEHPTYWAEALPYIANSKLKIAFTYGMEQMHHRAFIAPFLGARLQNEACYVSPLADGRTPVYHPDYIDKEPYSYGSWIKRLREKKITHLLCFAPRCKELEWARSHPESFKMLAGNNAWGFFEIK